MRAFVYIVVLFMATQYYVTGQTYLDLAVDMNADKNYQRARVYGKKAWEQKPTVFTAYQLAYAMFNLAEYDSAAVYAYNSLHNIRITKDVIFTANQIKQIGAIIDHYKNLVIARLERNGSSSASRYAVMLVLSESDGSMLDMEKAAAIQQQQQATPTWGEHIQSLRNIGVDEATIDKLEAERSLTNLLRQVEESREQTPEVVNERLQEFFGYWSNSQSISITWIDSTKNTAADNPYSQYYSEMEENSEYYEGYDEGWEGYGSDNPFLQYYSYDGYYFAELFDEKKKKELIKPMATLYKEYLNGSFDPDNPLIKKYNLNKKNIDVFMEEVFPEIYAKRKSLDEILND